MLKVRSIQVVAFAGLMVATACASNDPVYSSFHSEAGAISFSDFGNATMNNTLVMTGERSYTIELSRRFELQVKVMKSADENAEAAASIVRPA